MLTAAFAVVSPAQAHHSFAKFDLGSSIEIEGEVTEVHWQNPHIRFTVRGSGADGRIQIWNLETNSPGILRRAGTTLGWWPSAIASKSRATPRSTVGRR